MPQTVDRRTVRSWIEELDTVSERIAPRFARSELRERARSYLRGLLSGAERKNSWRLAEVAGNTTPYGLQHLLAALARKSQLGRRSRARGLEGVCTRAPGR